MLYLSPSSLFGEAIPQPFDKKAIQLARKKLLAELELNEGNDLQILGRSYGKNDIINYFENLLKDNVLEYNAAISRDRTLLVFLEKAAIHAGERFDKNPMYTDESFIRWISPWFTESFSHLILECFRSSAYLKLTTLFNNPWLMTPTDQEQVWINVAKLIRDNIWTLDRYQSQGRQQQSRHWIVRNSTRHTIRMSAVSGLMDQNYIRMIGLLPESRFGELRNKYAFVMMQACIFTFNTRMYKRDLAEQWITNAQSLAVSPDLKNQIADKLFEFKRIRKKSIPLPLRIIIISIVIGSNLFRMCSKDDNTPHYQPAPSYKLPVIIPDTGKIKAPSPPDSLLLKDPSPMR
jgi:hypothetical protein